MAPLYQCVSLTFKFYAIACSLQHWLRLLMSFLAKHSVYHVLALSKLVNSEEVLWLKMISLCAIAKVYGVFSNNGL